MSEFLPGIEHIVVVMLENRSLDNMLGTLFLNDAPSVFLPPGSSPIFDGWRPGLSNPSNAGYFTGDPAVLSPVRSEVDSSTVPDPDPEETFANVSFQLFGPDPPTQNARWPMQGFLVNYATKGATDPTQILQCHAASQVPVLATLARSYAVCDAWFASVPSQTLPNRAFVHAGTSNGHVDNGSPPDPLAWDVPTIFNVLERMGVGWAVYHDTVLVPSLTHTMLPQLWDESLAAGFRGLDSFVRDCAADNLPKYSFIEPSFLIDPNDEHPPHDVNAGEALLRTIWTAVSTSPAFSKTLLLITFDEHGGCYDHVLPPFGATPPDPASTPGEQGFGFDRFGVRVPMVAISPRIAAGTVFRSDTDTPYDHTSILATLHDWLQIPASARLPSKRIAKAPTLAQILTLSEPRTDVPVISSGAPQMRTSSLSTASLSTASLSTASLSTPLNDLQRALVAGAARRAGREPAEVLRTVLTRQHAIDYFTNPGPSAAF